MGGSWRTCAVVAALLAAGCTGGPAPDRDTLPGVDEAGDDEIATVVSGLDTIWDVAFAPSGTMLITERPGRVWSYDPSGGGDPRLVLELDVAEDGEAGLMGLALSPRFASDAGFYVYYTDTGRVGTLTNQVERFRLSGDGAVSEGIVLDDIPGFSIHDGGRIRFGPDGLLYVTAGDAGVPSNAQDPMSKGGKVLRIAPDGSIPDDNPTAGSPVYTRGHRNPQGLAFHPVTKAAYVTEHGPENFDEVNVLEAGDNYGWPAMRGPAGEPVFHGSIWDSGQGGTIAPAGAAFIVAPGSVLDGSFVFGNLKGRRLHVLTLDDQDPTIVTADRVVFDGDFGRIRAVTWHGAPDDALYLGTSNKDGRGSPGPEDDRVVRIPLAALEAALAP